MSASGAEQELATEGGRSSARWADALVLPYWFDRPATEAMEIALAAEEAGVPELWVGEMATFDAFALAGAIATRTSRIGLSIGPLALGVRSPVALALGVSSVSELGGRPARLALGASSPAIVAGWHGREFGKLPRRLRETVAALRPLLRGNRADFEGDLVRTKGFRLRTARPHAEVTVAAFGPQMVRAAGQCADRLLVNLVSPALVGELRRGFAAWRGAFTSAQGGADPGSSPGDGFAVAQDGALPEDEPVPDLMRGHAGLDASSRLGGAKGGNGVQVAGWVPAALEPDERALRQLAAQVAVYLRPPGYGEMFTELGFGELVAAARSGSVGLAELAGRVPLELLEAVCLLGDEADLKAGIGRYRRAGLDHVAVVPVTAHDPGGRRLLEALTGG